MKICKLVYLKFCPKIIAWLVEDKRRKFFPKNRPASCKTKNPKRAWCSSRESFSFYHLAAAERERRGGGIELVPCSLARLDRLGDHPLMQRVFRISRVVGTFFLLNLLFVISRRDAHTGSRGLQPFFFAMIYSAYTLPALAYRNFRC